MISKPLATLLVLISLACPALAEDPKPQKEEPKKEEPKKEEGKREEAKKPEPPEKKPDPFKPYDKVITADAKTDPGIFLVHRVDDKIFFEIPVGELRKEFLWVTQIARTQAGFGYGGTPAGNRVVRWEMRDNDILLRNVRYTLRAETTDSVRNAVEASSVEPIIRKFPIQAWGKDRAPVIDVTDLFLGDLPEFSPKKQLGAGGADRGRSFLEQIKSFPENIETKVLMTYTLAGPSPDPSLSAVTVQLHYSMVRLPDQLMKPRKHDERVGFFSVGFQDFASPDHKVSEVRYITRWRLEKKDPAAEISEPKKPIVFYIGREVPDKWRPWIKKGVEAWQPAFEKAGFKNAVQAKDAPSFREDPDWDAEDARYSSIRWLPSAVENAMGPHVHDPRTGEILESDIILYHNVLKLVRDWYFVQVSPMDPRAQKLPLPDDLMGELLAYVVTHEVGHTLGFPHNMKASSAYTVEQLRDPEFTKQYGTEASIMDYGRFNYVAQPGDGAHLIPVVGPYDFFAVEWGYREFPDEDPSRSVQPPYQKLLAQQVTDARFRFGNPNATEDPSQQTEDLGSDPVKATELGLKNIERIAGFLVEATCRENEDYDLLKNMYDRLIRQRDTELTHVANVVGGVIMNNLWYGQKDRIFDPVPAEKQREAVQFLNQHAFRVPAYLLDPNILHRLESSGVADRLLTSQRTLLFTLFNDRRLKRMAEHADRNAAEAYAPSDLLADLRAGLFSELEAASVSIDLHRRNLQRAYVELLASQMSRTDASSDLPALSRGELKTIQAAVKKAAGKAGQRVVSLHLEELDSRIERLLNPPKA